MPNQVQNKDTGGTECMPQHTILFCKPEMFKKQEMANEKQNFCDDVYSILARGNVVEGNTIKCIINIKKGRQLKRNRSSRLLILKGKMLSSSKIIKDPLNTCIMIQERMRRKVQKKRNKEGKIKTSADNKIYKRTNHLLVESTFERWFKSISFN